jgi:hypothetical protein
MIIVTAMGNLVQDFMARGFVEMHQFDQLLV